MRGDVIGLVLSGTCLVHCLLLPVALVAAPSLSLWLGATENTVHWVLFAAALAVTGWALNAGFRRHGAWLPPLLGAVGLLVMLVGAAHLFGRTAEAGLTIVGAAVVAVAHICNVRLCRRAGGADAGGADHARACASRRSVSG